MITFQCGACGKSLKAKPEFSGRKVKCPDCQHVEIVPQSSATPSAGATREDPTYSPVQDSSPAFQPTEAAPTYKKHIKKKRFTWPVAMTAIVVLGGVGVAVWMSGILPFGQPPKLIKVDDQEVVEGNTIKISARLSQPSNWKGKYRFRLKSGPKDAKIGKNTGKFTWKPTESDGPTDHAVTISVTETESKEILDKTSFEVSVTEHNQAPVLEQIGDKDVAYGDSVSFNVTANDDDIPKNKLSFSFSGDVPAGATLNSNSGALKWTPQATDAGKSFEFVVQVTDDAKKPLEDHAKFTVNVTGAETAAEKLVKKLKSAGIEAELAQGYFESPFRGKRYALSIDGTDVELFDYESADAANTDADQVSKDAKQILGRPQTWTTAALFFKQESLIAVLKGDHPQAATVLARHFGESFAVAKKDDPKPTVETVAKSDPDVKLLETLYNETNRRERRKKLFSTREYASLRKLFATRFEKDHEREIREAYGDDREKLAAWFDKHADLKEEFYTAINPKHDDISAALRLMNSLIDQFPKQIERYGGLAIAVSVVWDKERPGVYHYANHQRRTKSSMPDSLATAVDNFRYFINAEKRMGGRVLYLPWEFLTLLVDHKTPVDERQWALSNYMSKSVMFGKCYHDVPYDTMMLDTKSAKAKLNGQDYTLPKIREFGGVCAMQADFAARVGKSIGVPAAYVGGMSSYGAAHAWVMWVELKSATKTSIGFTLESHGRYRGDKYYVGNLRDPQTGQRITDRDLELRLQTVGLNAMAKRQADLVMQAYPILRDELRLDTDGQLDYLSQVIRLCPGNEAAWFEIAAIASSNEELDKRNKKLLTESLDSLFKTFVNVPDFTWKVFDDLTSYETDVKKRIKYYERLVSLYLNAGRPDLAFAARLKLTDYLLDDDRKLEAIEGLALTIKKFPSEGQFVPKMLDRLEKLAADVEGADEHLVRFYQAFLPKIPQIRGNRPSKYCMNTFQRGIDLLEAHGQQQLAQSFAVELAKIKAGMGRKK